MPKYLASFIGETYFMLYLERDRFVITTPDGESRFLITEEALGYNLSSSDRRQAPLELVKDATGPDIMKILLFRITDGIGTRNIIRLPSDSDEFPNALAPGWTRVGKIDDWGRLAKDGELQGIKLRNQLPQFSYLAGLDLKQVVDSLQDFNAAPLFTQFLWTRHAPTIEAGYFTPPEQWVWPPEGAL